MQSLGETKEKKIFFTLSGLIMIFQTYIFFQPLTTVHNHLFAGSLVSLGCLLGAWCVGAVGTRLGRRLCLQFTAIPLLVGSIALSLSTNVYVMLGARYVRKCTIFTKIIVLISFLYAVMNSLLAPQLNFSNLNHITHKW